MWIPKVQCLLEGGAYLSLSALRGNTVIISVCINHISPLFIMLKNTSLRPLTFMWWGKMHKGPLFYVPSKEVFQL